jgi:hypothetical protein
MDIHLEPCLITKFIHFKTSLSIEIFFIHFLTHIYLWMLCNLFVVAMELSYQLLYVFSNRSHSFFPFH